MPNTSPTSDLIRRVRAGDEPAATELVRLYEPTIRRRIRVWLRMQDPAMRRAFDSMDVCQSVLASFFARAASGQYELDSPGQVAALLLKMARHKLLHLVKRHTAGRRDIRRNRPVGPTDSDGGIAGHEPSPSACVAGRELLEAVRLRLDEDERRLADRRGEGNDWATIAAEVGGTAEGRRKQLARALERVAGEMRIDDRVADRPERASAR
jgi:DNA-directed RNA polymerase specialized sigma24 family protein